MDSSQRLKCLLMPVVMALGISSASAQVDLTSTVTGSGGINAANASLQITGTLGQPIIGTIQQHENRNQQGFWQYQNKTAAEANVAVTADIPTAGLEVSCSPNPVRHSARIEFHIPYAGDVQLTLYDRIGREIRTLFNGSITQNSNSVEMTTQDLPSGMYLIKMSMSAGERTLPIFVIQ